MSESEVENVTQQYMESRFTNALYQLRCALNVPYAAVPIQPHILVCRVLALLKYQSQQIRKLELKRTRMCQQKMDKFNRKRNGDLDHDTAKYYEQSNVDIVNQNRNNMLHENDPRYLPQIGNGLNENENKECDNESDMDIPPMDHLTDIRIPSISDCDQNNDGNDGEQSDIDPTMTSEWEQMINGIDLDDDIIFDIPMEDVVDIKSNFM